MSRRSVEKATELNVPVLNVIKLYYNDIDGFPEVQNLERNYRTQVLQSYIDATLLVYAHAIDREAGLS